MRSTIGAARAMRRSIYEVDRNGRGAMNADIQSISTIFMIFDPMIFPTAISVFHFFAAIKEVTISGALVPIATIVSPTRD